MITDSNASALIHAKLHPGMTRVLSGRGRIARHECHCDDRDGAIAACIAELTMTAT